MVRIIKPTLVNSEIEYTSDFNGFDVDNKMSHNLSQLVGYVESTSKTMLVRVDSDGVLLVNTEGSIANNFEPSQQTVTDSATLIVSSRDTRNNLLIRNLGSETVYISQADSLATDTAYPIDGGSVLSLDNYIGALYGITVSGSSDIRVVEVY